jgi:hypothetical protein
MVPRSWTSDSLNAWPDEFWSDPTLALAGDHKRHPEG